MEKTVHFVLKQFTIIMKGKLIRFIQDLFMQKKMQCFKSLSLEDKELKMVYYSQRLALVNYALKKLIN